MEIGRIFKDRYDDPTLLSWLILLVMIPSIIITGFIVVGNILRAFQWVYGIQAAAGGEHVAREDIASAGEAGHTACFRFGGTVFC